ncbi:MAG TPA: hydroxymethylbilane synthase [Terracidiphilus sp.]|jgi:hydroxymethylbilane synthase
MMNYQPIRIGSRGSQLALWQANHIADQLRALGHEVSIEIIRTTGDRLQEAGAPSIRDTHSSGGPFIRSRQDADEWGNDTSQPTLSKGIFIKEIEEALAAGEIDLAVHSLKDLPTALDPRFALAAIPERADPRDAFVCEEFWALHALPLHARIGTTSPRRRAQLLALRPDITFVDLRGNVDTRLRKLAEGQCDALVLAAAGLDRLARAEWVHQRFTIDELCPAPGQGALALETRAETYAVFASPERDNQIRSAVAALDHPATRFSVEVERTTLDALGGGCSVPIGVHCAPVPDTHGEMADGAVSAWRIHAQVLAPDGEQMICATTEAPVGVSALELGLELAADLKARGADELLAMPA